MTTYNRIPISHPEDDFYEESEREYVLDIEETRRVFNERIQAWVIEAPPTPRAESPPPNDNYKKEIL